MFLATLIAMTASCSRVPDPTPQGETPAGVAWIAQASHPGSSRDRSGLAEPISGTEWPQDLLGSIGSAVTYTGVGNLYLAGNDRGPEDGAVAFLPRFQELEIVADAKSGSLDVRLGATTLYCRVDSSTFSGLSSDFDPSQDDAGRRFDPEGLRVSRAGTLFTSDEYGPFIDEWTAQGVHLRRIALPAKLHVAKRSGDAKDELPPHNLAGRQSNRGMEGLARSPDGTRLFGLMQSPLIQDGALDEKNERIGHNIRLIELELASGATRELVYPLDSPKNGTNEILAVGAESFLVIERDGKKGKNAECKRVYLIDAGAATDVSELESLPTKGLPAGFRPVEKRLLIDFLDPRFDLAGKSMPEKIEGLAFGPDLADGRRLLIVSIDNDFEPEAPNAYWAFAIDPALLPGFQAPVFDVAWSR